MSHDARPKGLTGAHIAAVDVACFFFRIFSNWSQLELSKIWDIFIVVCLKCVLKLDWRSLFFFVFFVVVVNLGGSLR